MGVKISNLPAIVTPALTDVLPVVQGGVTYYGSGAIPTGIGAPGNNASNYGSGGSGGATGTATNRAGGNGTGGLIIVWDFA